MSAKNKQTTFILHYLELKLPLLHQTFAENQKYTESNALSGLFAALFLWFYLVGHFSHISREHLLASSLAGINEHSSLTFMSFHTSWESGPFISLELDQGWIWPSLQWHYELVHKADAQTVAMNSTNLSKQIPLSMYRFTLPVDSGRCS